MRVNAAGTGYELTDVELPAQQDYSNIFAAKVHRHDADYASLNHTHSTYSLIGHMHSEYAPVVHNHDTLYAPLSHVSNASNPHSTTAAQVGLGNVLNVAQVPASVGADKGYLVGFSSAGVPAGLAAGGEGQILVRRGAAALGLAWENNVVAGGGLKSVQSWQAAGTGTWAKPGGVTKILIEVYGAGGSGAGGPSNGTGGGGGAGGVAIKVLDVTNVNSVNFSIGAGGSARPGGFAGVDGGTTNFGGIAIASGGKGGGLYGTTLASGGVGNTGDILMSGSGSGGGSTFQSSVTGGLGGSNHRGGGGAGGTGALSGGSGGPFGGGGGGGGTNGNSGAGGDGGIIVWEF